MPRSGPAQGILDSKEWNNAEASLNDFQLSIDDDWGICSPSDWWPAVHHYCRRPARWVLGRVRIFLLPLKPLFKTQVELPEANNGRPMRPTAYLDGLRGFAAFLVYWHHHQLWAHEEISRKGTMENAWGWHGEYHFITLPVVRTLFTGGHFAVATFFVISGYVLSTKPLALVIQMQQQQASTSTPIADAADKGRVPITSAVDETASLRAKLSEALGSALFRRWLRLYLPLAATTFAYMSTWHLLGLWVDGAKPHGNLRDEAWWWYLEFKNFSFVFNAGGLPWFSYNPHTWSIPIEFKGSLVVYTTVLALARCTRNMRLALEALLVVYFMWIADGWYCALFVAGLLLCDLDLLAARDDLPRFFGWFAPWKTVLFYTLFLASLILGGVPSHDNNVAHLRENPGWYYLSLLKPQAVFDYKWFYLLWAAIFLVASTPHIPVFRRFLEGPRCQTLGRLSYALYLVHGPVIWTLGDRLYAAVGWPRPNVAERRAHIGRWMDAWPLPREGWPLGLEPAFWLPHVVLLPCTLWLAGLVARALDEPAVELAQWLYGRSKDEGRGPAAGDRISMRA